MNGLHIDLCQWKNWQNIQHNIDMHLEICVHCMYMTTSGTRMARHLKFHTDGCRRDFDYSQLCKLG